MSYMQPSLTRKPQNSLICWLSKQKKRTAFDSFHRNGPHGKIPTKVEPIRIPGITSRLPYHMVIQKVKFINQSSSRLAFLHSSTRSL